MPCVVKVCGRRGAIGAACGLVLLAGWVTRSSFGLADVSSRRPYIGSPVSNSRSASMAPEPRGCCPLRCMVRLFGPAGKGLMLFNSYPFIFLFLPITLLGYFALGRRGHLAPVIWLALASLAFYSFGNWQFVALLLGSIAFNYFVGLLLITRKLRPRLRFAVLTLGVAGDLLVLGIFKYAGFLAANLNALFSAGITVNVLLPVGISFYTFTQIAFLVDAYRGKVAGYRLPHYALFVTYFPHLIAGPILHHKDMIPQFERAEAKRPNANLMLCGLIIFAIGLFEKTGL